MAEPNDYVSLGADSYGGDLFTNPLDFSFDNGLGGQGGFSGDLGNTGTSAGGMSTQMGGAASPGFFQQLGNLPLGAQIALGTTAITGLTGLAGVIQKAIAGDEVARQTLERTIATASPQEQQAFAQALAGLQTNQGLAFGPGGINSLIGGQSGLNLPGAQQQTTTPGQQAPFGGQYAQALGQGFGGSAELGAQGGDLGNLTRNLYANLLGRSASDSEVQAWAQTGNPQQIIQGILGSQEFGNRGVPLNQAITNLYQGALGRTPGAQEVQGWQQQLGAPDTPGGNTPIPLENQGLQQSLNQLGGGQQRFNQFSQGALPIIQQMLQGGLNFSPELNRTVEQAFQPQMGDIATQAIESARRRGFAGGAELLQQGPAGAIAGPALSDLQGQMAQAKIGLASGLPGQAIGNFGQLQNLNQQLVQSLGGVGQLGINNRLNLLGASTQGLTGLTNLGNVLGQQRIGQGGSTSTTSQPGGGLLGAFQGLGQVAGGVGGALGGLSQAGVFR